MAAQKNKDVYELLWNDSLVILLAEKKQGERKKGSENIYVLIFTKLNGGQSN